MTFVCKKIFAFLVTLISLCVYFSFHSEVLAWTNTGGGDHGGDDWTISSNTNVAGVHTNIGTFTINSSTTATVQAYDGGTNPTYGNFEVQATTITINGAIAGTSNGFRGTTTGTGEGTGAGTGDCASNGASGGSHGGFSGQGDTAVNLAVPSYGSYSAPVTKGSAGGTGFNGACVAGGNGGASIKLTASGTLTVGGTITTSGGSAAGSRAGGGAGGSVYLVAGTLAGSSAITASGGAGWGGGGGSGGGGGGRIALHYTSANNYSGTMTAAGGAAGSGSATAGTAGTIVIVDDTNNDLTIPTTQYWYTKSDVEGGTQSWRDVSITGSSTLYIRGYYTGNSDGVGAVFSVRNFTINSGSSIDGAGFGFKGVAGATGSGPGGGGGGCVGNVGGAGGSHGAHSGDAYPWTYLSVAPYGSLLAPVTLGSAGGGGTNGACQPGANGGSALRITATSTITVSGAITMNGSTAGITRLGGGAGGSVYLTAATLAGASAISANGGNGNNMGGGGSGGRIALHYTSANNYSGTVTATGGTNGGGQGVAGLNGTYVIVDDTNNDITVPTTQYWYASSGTEGGLSSFRDFTVTGSSTLNIRGYYTSNSDGVGINLSVRNLTINSGSSIAGTGLGYQFVTGAGNGTGPSPGSGTCSTGNIGGSGAGHGGSGGNGAGGSNVGGSTTGSATAPTLLGSSGGGGYTGGCNFGGHGGSAIKITASSTVTLTGSLSMNGANGGLDPKSAATGRTAGGAGGSIWIVTSTFAGGGNVSANGGNGVDFGGGGGGGRIYIQYSTSNTWSGSASVTGGTSGTGGAGNTGTSNIVGIAQAPSSLAQYKSDGTTTIASGGTTNETTVVLKFSMSAGANTTLTPKVEVRNISTSFSNTATNTGSDVSYTGSPVTGSVTVSGLSDLTNYHWQAQVCDSSSFCSAWVAFGGSPYDFRIVTNQNPNTPTNLGPSEMTNGSYTTDDTPSFTFSLSDPDSADTVQFNIVIDDSSDFASPVVNYTSSFGAQGSYSFTVGQNAGGGSYSVGSSGQTLSDASYYWRVRAIDNMSGTGSYATANSGSVAFILYRATLSLTSPGDNEYTMNERPTFKWQETNTTGASISTYDFIVDNPAPLAGEVQGDFTISGIPASRTTDYVTTRYTVHYDGFSDSDTSNNYISIFTKSSTDWASSENDGKLREGMVTWTVRSNDSGGKSVSSSRNLFVDNYSPVLEITGINNSTRTVSGKLTDILSSGVASGPYQIEFKFVKKNKPATYHVVYFSSVYYTCDGSLVTDNTENSCNKYATFSTQLSDTQLSTSTSLVITGKDKAGNLDSATYKVAGGKIGAEQTPTTTPAPTSTPKPVATPTPTPEPAPAPIIIPPEVVETVTNIVTQVVETVAEVVNQTIETVSLVVTNEATATIETITEVANVIIGNVTNLTGDVAELISNPTLENLEVVAIESTNAGVATATVVAAASVAVNAVTTTSVVTSALVPVYAETSKSALLLPVQAAKSLGEGIGIFLAPFFGFSGLRKKPKNGGTLGGGTVFDGLTGSPLDKAFIVAYSASGNLTTSFTNDKGSFQLNLRPDSYLLKAERQGFEFPSKLITVTENSQYENIYIAGKKIEVKMEGEKIPHTAVPMDPKTDISKLDKSVTKFKSSSYGILAKVSPAFSVLGLVATGIAAWADPGLYYKGIFVATSAFSVIKYGGKFIKPKKLSA